MELFIEHSILDDEEGSHHFGELLRHLFGHQIQQRLPLLALPEYELQTSHTSCTCR